MAANSGGPGNQAGGQNLEQNLWGPVCLPPMSTGFSKGHPMNLMFKQIVTGLGISPKSATL